LTPEEARAFFPALERYVWLTHGGGSPRSLRVREAVEAAARRPFEDDDPWAWAQSYYDDREALLSSLGRMIGASAEDVTLTRGTAHGLSLLRGLDWGPGDNIVSAHLEFPANLYPWLALEHRGVEVRLVSPEDGRVTPESVLDSMDDRTRAVSLSLVQFWNGYRIDAARIGEQCRSRGVAFALDAAQAAGVVRIDVGALRCDLLTAGAMKWLQGPIGIGFCYVHPELAERIDPPIVGLGSVASHDYYEPNLEWAPGARRFQESACSFHDVAGFRASMELLEAVGHQTIEDRVLDLTSYLGDGLDDRGCAVVEPWPRKREESSGIISFRPARSPAEVVETLGAAGILAHERGDSVRFSPHYYNTREEMDRALNALPA
jgi:selenocysteine lyase/cysteine desulfurase